MVVHVGAENGVVEKVVPLSFEQPLQSQGVQNNSITPIDSVPAPLAEKAVLGNESIGRNARREYIGVD